MDVGTSLNGGRHNGEAAPEPAALACADLTYAYGDRHAVAELSFEVRPGEADGLLGPNGAGKTTTIRMVCGIAAPQSGLVTITCHPLRASRAGRAARTGLGYVPQDIALFPNLTLVENLVFWATMLGVPRRRRRARAHEVLEVVGRPGSVWEVEAHIPTGAMP